MGPSMAILKAAGCSAQESGAGCCGMAGSFGYEAEHYDVSRKIGEERLFPAVNGVSAQTIVSGRRGVVPAADRALHRAQNAAHRRSAGEPDPPGMGMEPACEGERRGLSENREHPWELRLTNKLSKGRRSSDGISKR